MVTGQVNGERFDFAIAGAGIVGLTTAVLLTEHGYTVALVDPDTAAPAALLPDQYDLRTYALTPASLRVLQSLGVEALLASERLAPFRGMEVRDARSSGCLSFDATRLGRESLGTIVEHANLHNALGMRAAASRQLRRHSAAVAAVEAGGEGWTVTLDDGVRFEADLLLACDGANSPLRAMLGIEPAAKAFDQAALICNVETERPHNAIARQRFLPDGPLAFLPLPPAHACSIVWTTNPDHAMAAVGADDAAFAAELRVAFDDMLGEIRTTSKRVAIPLYALHADTYTAGRAVLLGDAAHVVHPLAGQGLNLGIMDAAALADAFAARDPLDLKFPRGALRRFERTRRGENQIMAQLTTALNRLFRDEHKLVRHTRGAGMRIIDHIEPLKTWMMLRAMGDAGDVPAPAARHRARSG